MIVNIKTKCELIDVFNSTNSCTDRQYLISNVFKNKIDKIVYVASVLKSDLGCEPYIEVKYDFGRRPKRIEIVYKNQNSFYLCKITKFSEFDKDALELNAILQDIINNNTIKNFQLFGLLVFMSDYNEDIVLNFIETQGLLLQHKKII